jgi:hypothetical protein
LISFDRVAPMADPVAPRRQFLKSIVVDYTTMLVRRL